MAKRGLTPRARASGGCWKWKSTCWIKTTARRRATARALQQKQQLVLNLVSSPGSGKTTLLTETLTRLKGRADCAVIEGDQQTVNDAARIRATGTPAIEVNTGKGCHLDAQMIADAAPRLPLADHGILFIENVGNFGLPGELRPRRTP